MSSVRPSETAHLRSFAGAFENRTKKLGVHEGSANFNGQINIVLVLVAFASSEGSGEAANLRSLDRAFANHT